MAEQLAASQLAASRLVRGGTQHVAGPPRAVPALNAD